MYQGNSWRIFPIVLVLVVIAIVVTLFISIGSLLFGGAKQSTVDTSQQELVNVAADHNVRMITRGPIVANEDFRSSTIDISSSSRTVSYYTGYLDQTLATERYDNNVKAYESFVYALDRLDLTNGAQLEGAADDTRGICATGSVYEFEIRVGQNVIKRLWTTSCRNGGSLRANVSQVRDLFFAQVPRSSELLDQIEL